MIETDRVGLERSEDKPLFALMHGSWHGAWCWGDLRDELEREGYDSVAIEFPNDVPGASFNDYSNEARYQITEVADGREVVAVAHSRAANVAPRLAGSLALKHIVYLCGSFENSTLLPLIQDLPLDFKPPRKYSDALQSAIKSDTWGMSEFGEEHAVRFFFHDCDLDIQWFAPTQLRRQFKSSSEIPPETWPDQSITPQTYIMAKDDRVISPAWSAYIAEHVLKVPLISIESGHSPFYSQPNKLASLLIDITIGDTLIPAPREGDSARDNSTLEFVS